MATDGDTQMTFAGYSTRARTGLLSTRTHPNRLNTWCNLLSLPHFRDSAFLPESTGTRWQYISAYAHVSHRFPDECVHPAGTALGRRDFWNPDFDRPPRIQLFGHDYKAIQCQCERTGTCRSRSEPCETDWPIRPKRSRLCIRLWWLCPHKPVYGNLFRLSDRGESDKRYSNRDGRTELWILDADHILSKAVAHAPNR